MYNSLKDEVIYEARSSQSRANSLIFLGILLMSISWILFIFLCSTYSNCPDSGKSVYILLLFFMGFLFLEGGGYCINGVGLKKAYVKAYGDGVVGVSIELNTVVPFLTKITPFDIPYNSITMIPENENLCIYQNGVRYQIPLTKYEADMIRKIILEKINDKKL